MFRIVRVRRRKMGKTFHYKCGALSLENGDMVILQVDRGNDYGEVVSNVEDIDDKKQDQSMKEIKRRASEGDLKIIEENEIKAEECKKVCSKKIKEFHLAMKLAAVEYSFDRTQIVVYFTADGRIDFRALVKDLANIFRVRIELRQIGVRDEAKMLGGYGICGRTLCCSSFLKDFTPVTVRMAKDQRLPLNPSKISGVCGRLMCCLIYEHDSYKELMKAMPREGTVLNLPEGKCRVMDINILQQSIHVQFEDGRRVQMEVSNIPGHSSIKSKWADFKDVIQRDDTELKKLEGTM